MWEPVLLASYVALWALVVCQGLLLLRLVRVSGPSPPARLSAAARAPSAAPPTASLPMPGALTGEPAPPFTTIDVIGAPVDSARFAGRRRLFVFLAPNCPECETMWADLRAMASAEQAIVVLVCVARAQPCRQFAERYGLGLPLLVDTNGALATRFGIAATPTAVLIHADDVVGTYRHLGASNDPTQMLQQFIAQISTMRQVTPAQHDTGGG